MTSTAVSRAVGAPVAGSALRIAACAAALCALATVSAAQTPPPATGPRVAAFQPDLAASGAAHSRGGVPWNQGHSLLGSAIGVGAGAALGAAIGAIAWQPCHAHGLFDCMGNPNTRGDAMLLGAGIGAVAGGLVGWAIGASIHSERWLPVRGARVHIAPVQGGAALSASIGF